MGLGPVANEPHGWAQLDMLSSASWALAANQPHSHRGGGRGGSGKRGVGDGRAVGLHSRSWVTRVTISVAPG